jgi:hypothetical protein
MNTIRKKSVIVFVALSIIGSALISCSQKKKYTNQVEKLCNELRFENPEHGFVSSKPASIWEESLICGNGTIGVLIPGDVNKDRIVLSHEKIFLPKNGPMKGPDLGSITENIRIQLLEGNYDGAAELFEKQSLKAGFTQEFVWTNPHIPACQLEFESLKPIENKIYARTVNYETGEAKVAFSDNNTIIHRDAFVSRYNNVAVIKFSSPSNSKLYYKFKLSEMPINKSDVEATEEEFKYNPEDFLESLNINAENHFLTYSVEFKIKWKGSLKSYKTVVKILPTNGNVKVDEKSLVVEDADEIFILASIELNYDSTDSTKDILQEKLNNIDTDYNNLLASHKKIHSEMFNRFGFNLENDSQLKVVSEELQASSTFYNFNQDLLVQLMKAGRYNIVCSTGELPPTLQGIWGGTWMPQWSGDFTLNGNVPSAIAAGLNGNFPEVTKAYLDLMIDWYDDYKLNAQEIFGINGIFVPSRGSDMGNCYTFNVEYPMLYWWAGAPWASHFFYDYWMYTGDEKFLKNKALPFMLDTYGFIKEIIYKHNDEYIFIPSYSPEIGPLEKHPIAINATMDVATLKQLVRNLIVLANQGYIEDAPFDEYKEILENLPKYAIDSSGELKEWIWEGFDNNNTHRHASHLYPLYDGIDPEFINNPALIDAAKRAIESRLEYRRIDNGGEMAFGLVQLGTAAAHIKDVDHAYECVKWLSSSYWSPAFVSYHNPGAIFNLDISGGLPAIVIEMIIQSTANEVTLLPALPEQWPEGEIKGVWTRSGATVDLVWENNEPKSAVIEAKRAINIKLKFKEQAWDISIPEGQTFNWKME